MLYMSLYRPCIVLYVVQYGYRVLAPLLGLPLAYTMDEWFHASSTTTSTSQTPPLSRHNYSILVTDNTRARTSRTLSMSTRHRLLLRSVASRLNLLCPTTRTYTWQSLDAMHAAPFRNNKARTIRNKAATTRMY